ncbi:MAG: GNAT family N-acetyltransferase [Myxococcales bacterium]|nr:GNAT family N-acetyltransferase [Myxococcales bacterium]
MNIRRGVRADWPAVVEIYNHAVEEGLKTADTEPISLESRAQWFLQHEDLRHPIFVAEREGLVLGFCSLSPHRPGRRALRKVAEVSYYVHRDQRGAGVGCALLTHAVERAHEYGFVHLFALLLDVNQQSIRMLERAGFYKWGHLPEVADFDGVVCGQVIYGRQLPGAPSSCASNGTVPVAT